MERRISKFVHNALCVALVLLSAVGKGQFTQNGVTGYWKTLAGGVNPRGLAIGDLTVTPFVPSFQIRGDLLNTGHTPGEAFWTNEIGTVNTYWRLYHGGVLPANQRGRFFALTGDTRLYIDAPNNALRLQTNSLNRVHLNQTVSTAINGFAAAPRNGFLLLSTQADAYTNATSLAPFSRLHLMDDVGAVNPIIYAQVFGYRPWMRNGITFTGNADQSYIGHKYGVNDVTDFVIQWSDNPAGGPNGIDRMKFVFSSSYTGAIKGMGSLDGMEAMRFWPSSTTTVNVGIGDFAPAGTGDPLDRLDVLDSAVRIRMLPQQIYHKELQQKVVVVDSVTGRLNWRYASGIGTACDWTLLPSTHVVTAYAGAPCTDMGSGVGIGTSVVKAKLDVLYEGATNHGLSGNVGINSLFRRSVGGTAIIGTGSTLLNVFATGTMTGVKGTADNSTLGVGVVGSAGNSGNYGTATDLIGVKGTATGLNNAVRCVGVYGAASGAQSSNSWAAWFDGPGFLNQAVWIYSDANLKENVQDLDRASALYKLMQLRPKSYNFNTNNFGFLNLPEVEQRGLLSQDVELVFPDLVRNVTRPADLDSAGNEIHPQMELKAMNYEGLIPVLIAAVQEPHIENQTLREQITACCAQGTTDGRSQQLPSAGGESNSLRTERLLVQPNPIADQTLVRYYIAKEGRARLELSAEDGRLLDVLREERTTAGEHSYDWNTSSMAAGSYLLALMVDGNVIVKKVVKVGER